MIADSLFAWSQPIQSPKSIGRLTSANRKHLIMQIFCWKTNENERKRLHGCVIHPTQIPADLSFVPAIVQSFLSISLLRFPSGILPSSSSSLFLLDKFSWVTCLGKGVISLSIHYHNHSFFPIFNPHHAISSSSIPSCSSTFSPPKWVHLYIINGCFLVLLSLIICSPPHFHF